MTSLPNFEDYLPAYSPDNLLSIENMLVENADVQRAWEFQIVEAVIDEPIYAWPASFVAKAIVTRLVTDHCCTFLDFSPMCRVYMLGKQVPLRPMLTWDQRIAVVNKMPSFYRMFVGILTSLCEEPDFRALRPSRLREACCLYIKQCHCHGSGHLQLPWHFK